MGKARMRPASTPDGRENQMISLAMDCAEQQLRDGTASSQIICHYLKLATEERRLERERMAEENKLIKARTEQIQSQQRIEELYANAIKAMRTYGGHGDEDEDEDDEY